MLNAGVRIPSQRVASAGLGDSCSVTEGWPTLGKALTLTLRIKREERRG